MSIGKRFVHLVRSNLNSLLDRTTAWESDPGRSTARIEDLSDAELEAELGRRRTRREAADQAAQRASSSSSRRSYEQAAWEEVEQAVHGSGRYRTAGQRPPRQHRRTGGHAASPGRDARRARLYAQLECPYGADADTVRKHYRVMMRKYHPDMHSTSPQKQRLATELSQKLTAAYNELRRSP